jgi:hypothetical protein
MAAASVSAAGYRAIGPFFKANVGGPGWLDISARFALGFLVIFAAALLSRRYSYGFLGDIAGRALNVTDSGAREIILAILFAASSLVCLANAVLVLYEHVGWEAAAASVGSFATVFSGIMLLITKRNRRIRNPFREYMGSSPAQLVQYLIRSFTLRRPGSMM